MCKPTLRIFFCPVYKFFCWYLKQEKNAGWLMKEFYFLVWLKSENVFLMCNSVQLYPEFAADFIQVYPLRSMPICIWWHDQFVVTVNLVVRKVLLIAFSCWSTCVSIKVQSQRYSCWMSCLFVVIVEHAEEEWQLKRINSAMVYLSKVTCVSWAEETRMGWRIV